MTVWSKRWQIVNLSIRCAVPSSKVNMKCVLNSELHVQYCSLYLFWCRGWCTVCCTVNMNYMFVQKTFHGAGAMFIIRRKTEDDGGSKWCKLHSMSAFIVGDNNLSLDSGLNSEELCLHLCLFLHFTEHWCRWWALAPTMTVCETWDDGEWMAPRNCATHCVRTAQWRKQRPLVLNFEEKRVCQRIVF